MTTITEPHAPVSPSGHADATAATTATKTVTGALQADVDLEAYDEEQVRLMEERCILVDDQDVAYGEGSKKRCESGISALAFKDSKVCRPDLVSPPLQFRHCLE
jgi:hypothetical protein